METKDIKVYKAKKDKFIYGLLLFFIMLPISLFIFDSKAFSEKPFMLIPLALPIVFQIWCMLQTSYWLKGDKLYYKSGPLSGSIDINKITKISNEKSTSALTKPALAMGGLTIKYDRSKLIYIAPSDPQQVINDVLAINSNIIVKI